MPAVLENKLAAILEKNPAIKPTQDVQQMRMELQREHAALPADMPTETALRSKVSSLKAAKKWQAKADLM